MSAGTGGTPEIKEIDGDAELRVAAAAALEELRLFHLHEQDGNEADTNTVDRLSRTLQYLLIIPHKIAQKIIPGFDEHLRQVIRTIEYLGGDNF